MTKRGLAKTTVNDGWKQPKKRKPMTEAQRKIASANNINLNSLKFDYINQNRDQKFITEVDFSLNKINY